jgi:tight adherence protein C
VGPDGLTLLLVSGLVFACVALASYGVANALHRRERVRQRFGSAPAIAGPDLAEAGRPFALDPARLGLDAVAQRRLRGELLRAGYFRPEGVVLYTLARFALLLLLPGFGYLALTSVFATWGATEKAALAGALLMIAYYLPGAHLSRRARALQDKYRVTFPDFLDMLVVCINAGLSLEAALDRAARELGPADLELRANLDLMAGEMRAGKSTPEALKDLAERLGLREARSFAALLQQTIELGTDVAAALTTFSDEMRDRRMARAEEKASSLPPKLTLPLGLFIFPVVLIVVLTPAVMRVLGALGR